MKGIGFMIEGNYYVDITLDTFIRYLVNIKDAEIYDNKTIYGKKYWL